MNARVRSLLVLTALAASAGCSRASTRKPPPDTTDDPPCGTPGTAPVTSATDTPHNSSAGASGSAARDGEAIQATDLAHVDPAALLPQARRIAIRIDEHATLTSIFTRTGVRGGTVDLTGDGRVTYEFEWLYLDKSRPPGDDKVENGLWITAEHGLFSVMELHHASALSRPKALRSEPGPDPRCSGRDAWKAAAGNGVPENAVASLRYAPAFLGGPYVWDLRVEGHDDLRRYLDGATCAIVDRSRRRR